MQRTFVVSVFFLSVEEAAVLGCYLVFGGVLGARPQLLRRWRRRASGTVV